MNKSIPISEKLSICGRNVKNPRDSLSSCGTAGRDDSCWICRETPIARLKYVEKCFYIRIFYNEEI